MWTVYDEVDDDWFADWYLSDDMASGENLGVPVKFCPFCGIKLFVLSRLATIKSSVDAIAAKTPEP
jgi:hypothetical protein